MRPDDIHVAVEDERSGGALNHSGAAEGPSIDEHTQAAVTAWGADENHPFNRATGGEPTVRVD